MEKYEGLDQNWEMEEHQQRKAKWSRGEAHYFSHLGQLRNDVTGTFYGKIRLVSAGKIAPTVCGYFEGPFSTAHSFAGKKTLCFVGIRFTELFVSISFFLTVWWPWRNLPSTVLDFATLFSGDSFGHFFQFSVLHFTICICTLLVRFALAAVPHGIRVSFQLYFLRVSPPLCFSLYVYAHVYISRSEQSVTTRFLYQLHTPWWSPVDYP